LIRFSNKNFMVDKIEKEAEESENAGENVSEFEKKKSVLSGLDKKRKWAVAVLAFFAILMIFIWSRNINNKINDPFIYKGDSNTEISNSLENNSAKDTDGDGLSDSDELDIYETSPYLEDSDSDGVSDYEEIENGSNPNCAFGADCEGEDAEINNPDAEGELNMSEIISGGDSFSSEQLNEMKELLLELGYDQETIDSLSAEEIYQGILYLSSEVESSGDNSQTMSTTPENNLADIGDDANLIREAFVEAGYDEVFLEQISDDELIELYQEALSEYENN
jgi:hypothetical protein